VFCRLIEHFLAGDGNHKQAAILRIQRGFNPGSIAAAMAVHKDGVTRVQRLMIEESINVALSPFEPQELANAARPKDVVSAKFEAARSKLVSLILPASSSKAQRR
jgi:hypothetical protein